MKEIKLISAGWLWRWEYDDEPQQAWHYSSSKPSVEDHLKVKEVFAKEDPQK